MILNKLRASPDKVTLEVAGGDCEAEEIAKEKCEGICLDLEETSVYLA